MKTAEVMVTLSYFSFARLAQVSWSAAGAVAPAKHVTRKQKSHRYTRNLLSYRPSP